MNRFRLVFGVWIEETITDTVKLETYKHDAHAVIEDYDDLETAKKRMLEIRQKIGETL